MHIMSSSQIYTIFSSQKCTLYPLLTNTHYIPFSVIYPPKYTLYTLFRNALLLSTHYILFSEINIISFSQMNSISSFHRYAQCIIFPDRHRCTKNIFSSHKYTSSFQINPLYPICTKTHYITQKCTIYPLIRYSHNMHLK